MLGSIGNGGRFVRRLIVGLLSIVLVSAPFVVGRVSADDAVPTGMFLRNSHGEIYLVLNGLAVPIAVLQIDDEKLATMPVSPLWVIMQNGETTSGLRPEWAAGPLPLTSGANAPAETTAAQPSGPTWLQVAQWSGSGSKTTEPFIIAGSQWRIRTTVKKQSSGLDQLCMTTRTLSNGRLANNGCSNGGGETYGTAGTTGAMQMEISGVNDGWTVTVEELR